MNKTITTIEIEPVIKKKVPTNKNPGPESFTDEFYQTFSKYFRKL